MRLGADARLVGRVTGHEFAAREAAYPSYTGAPLSREKWFAREHDEERITAHVAAALGDLSAGIEHHGPRLVVLTQAVSDSHLAGLRQDDVSYIFAGEREIDLPAALETLNREMGIRRLLLEGGGSANRALLQTGLVDELSVVVAPSMDGVPDGPPCSTSLTYQVPCTP